MRPILSPGALRAALVIAAGWGLAALAVVALAADPPKPADPPAPAAAPVGKLPIHYRQLGLTAYQKTKIEGVTGAAAAKLHDLEAQITALREQEHADCLAVLTDAQKAALEKLAVGDTTPPAAPTPPPAKPPSTDK